MFMEFEMLKKFVLVFICIIVLLSGIGKTEAYAASNLQFTEGVKNYSLGNTYESLDFSVNGTVLNYSYHHMVGAESYAVFVFRKNKEYTNSYVCNTHHETEATLPGGTIKGTIDFSRIPDGSYYITVRRYNSADPVSTQLIVREISIVSKNSIPSIITYPNVAVANDKYRTSISSDTYCNKSMSDLSWVFVDPKSKEPSQVSENERVTFFKTCSDSICGYANSDIEKLRNIYVYIAKHFYYDKEAVGKGNLQYNDPYENLQSLFNGKNLPNSNTSINAIATCCIGYSATFIALARAQGIPCRMVKGRSGKYNWNIQSNETMNTKNHYWVEAYVNGKWCTFDPTKGCINKCYISEKEWNSVGDACVMTYFATSNQCVANTHYVHYYYRGDRSCAYMNNYEEINQIREFLATGNNGYKLNSSFNLENKGTWSERDCFYTDGYGSVYKINWPGKDLEGTLNLKYFKELKYVYVKDNQLDGIKLSGAKNLKKISASGNNIKTIYLASAKTLYSAYFENNPIKNAKLYYSGSLRTIKATEGGSFGFVYNSSWKNCLKITATRDIGYKFNGIYRNDGKKVTSKTVSQFNPKLSKEYTLKFVLDSDSFKYYLAIGLIQPEAEDYVEAAEKRLAKLNYLYEIPDANYDENTVKAVEDFQVANGLEMSGEINEETWSILFSKDAI